MSGRRIFGSQERAKQIGISCFSIMALSWSMGCQQEDSQDKRRLPLEMIPGSFLVEMKASEDDGKDQRDELYQLAQGIAKTYGCQLGQPEDIGWEASDTGVLASSLNLTYHLNFTGCKLDEDKTVEILDTLIAKENIETVEANAVMTTMFRENDPLKNQQYYLNSVNRDQACQAAGAAKDQEIIVAVVDSGVERNHPDLRDQFFRDRNGRIIGANFVGKGSRGEPDDRWDDDNGHGTHVAGLVAATANNGVGIAGVAACANVKIMPIRVMGRDGRGNSLEIDRGIQWAAARGAHIINLSLGSNSVLPSQQSSHRKALYEDLARQGIIVFAAAGNDGLVNGSAYNSGGRRGFVYSYPASYDNVISVASTTDRNALSSFSNRGDRVDIAAPGSNTISTYPGQTYRSLSGTSMASPVAAGAYALALAAVQHTGQEKLLYNEVMELLMRSVSKNVAFSSRDVASGGVVNTLQLVNLMQTRFPAPSRGQPEEEPVIIPDEPADQQPAEPTPGRDDEFLFVGLRPNQQLTGSILIGMQNWPSNTATIDLYWITGSEWFPRAFTSFDRSNLTRDGRSVVTKDRYLLYGNRYLVAVARDVQGRRIQQKSVFLRGL